MSRPPLPPHDPSPVFRASGAPLQVRRSRSPWTPLLALAGAGLIGLAVFNSLSQAREARHRHAPTRMSSFAAAPKPTAPAASMAGRPAAVVTPPPGPATAPATADETVRLRAPVMVVDYSAVGPDAAPPAAVASAAEDDKLSPEERFAQKVSGGRAPGASAHMLHDLARVAPQGTVIPAVLETAIDSDLPGSVRAVVSRDVRGFDGTLVLIPQGSKLIGQYRSGVALGQRRAFVVWSRIITPAGASVDLGSPATDRLGRGGLAGETDSHFFQRFGSAMLLSVLNAGLEAAARSVGGDSGTALIINSPQAADNVAAIALQKHIDISVTIRVPQGTPLQVFVARDLDFTEVASRAP